MPSRGLRTAKNKEYNEKSTRSKGRHQGIYQYVLLILLALAEACGFFPIVITSQKTVPSVTASIRK